MTSSERGFKIAIFSLNQWTLDFTGNTQRIIKSVDLAYNAGAAYRAGPELELCGYSAEDAFFEQDTVYHSWSCLLEIMSHSAGMEMVIDIGMPVHHSALYNCRVIIYKGKILCIRAKTILAAEGIYREFRHFRPWDYKAGVVAYKLPAFVSEKLNQSYVPFGADYILELGNANQCDTLRVGWEICQELWDVKNVSSDLYQNFGCHLVINGSGSYWELRKLNTVLDMVKGISLRGGACYAFSNFVGCDGQRYVFYGRSCIYDKGQLVSITPTSTHAIFEEIQMITHIIYPRDIDEYRAQMAIRPDQAAVNGKVWNLLEPHTNTSQIDSSYKRFYLDAHLLTSARDDHSSESNVPSVSLRFELEIHQYVSLWMWDYLRRSGMTGFMMPLSGGLDSSSVATLVYSMCNYIHSSLKNQQVQSYFKIVHSIPPETITTDLPTPEAICKRLLKCCYLSTKYSSQATLRRAKLLSEAIGAEFIDLSLQDVYAQFRGILTDKDSDNVSLLDQNLQARLRMAATYYLSGGNRIVLATGNVDEGIMGYLTKYDCSSADINPIGGMCKDDLRNYLRYCCNEVFENHWQLAEVLDEIISAPPSAELTGSEQRDEDEIGITYDEISVLGKVRRGIYGCSGPRGAFETLWQNRHRQQFCSKIRCLKDETKSDIQKASELSELVKRFYRRYANNRHKLTVLTPALHTETYSPDDNRFDHRHFLYAPWTEQFKCIDIMLERIKESSNADSQL